MIHINDYRKWSGHYCLNREIDASSSIELDLSIAKSVGEGS